MAKVLPDGWRELTATGAAERKLQTLSQLAAGLDERYTVYHAVHWTRLEQNNFVVFGEIDFAIVGPTGKLLLIEQKSGFLTESADGLLRKHAGREQRVAIDMARTTDTLLRRLREFCKDDSLVIDALLYCPDYTVRQPGSAGIDPARIVDATRKDLLMPTIREILGDGDGPVDPPAAKEKIHRFMGDILQLVPEVNAVIGETVELYTRLSGGLSEWARRIEFEPFRLHVIGTAGSGKTQLAMAVYRDAIEAGRRPLYICYNRPLADHIAQIVPAGGEVATYHQFGDRLYRAVAGTPDFSRPGAFERIEATLDAYMPDEAGKFDELIVDEGQDFQRAWADNLLRFLRPGGRAWWLEDPMQNLYGRPPVPLPGWVALRSETNYRSPKDMLETLNRMLPLEHPVTAGSPVTGSEVEIVSYSDDADLVAKTVATVTRCIGLGFRRSHIALITYRGREHSKLTPYRKLGPYPLRAPTGRYDLFGNPVLTKGDLVIDSVHRFKGRAAPCVILTEIDFETLDQAAVRRIFVGATRAMMKLVLVASEKAAKILQDRLSNADHG